MFEKHEQWKKEYNYKMIELERKVDKFVKVTNNKNEITLFKLETIYAKYYNEYEYTSTPFIIKLTDKQKLSGLYKVCNLINKSKDSMALEVIVFMNCYQTFRQCTDNFDNVPDALDFTRALAKLQYYYNHIIYSNVFRSNYNYGQQYELLSYIFTKLLGWLTSQQASDC